MTSDARADDVKNAAAAILKKARTIHRATVVKATSAGLVCDGTTDNTTALNNLYAAYQASTSSGYEIVLPSGTCNFSSTLKWNITKPLTITGSGSNATVLNEPSSTSSFDGLVLTISGGADLTLSGFAISKSASMPSGTLFANEALKIVAQNGQNAGQVVVSNLWIEGANENDLSHGWATGLEMVDLSRPVIDNLNVKNAGVSETNPSQTGAPTPTSPGTTPAALAAGVGTDIYIHGVQNVAIDTAISNTQTNGGIAGIDLDNYQGFYMTNGDIVYSDYGIRSDSGAGLDENVNVTTSQFNDLLTDIYLYQATSVTVSSDLLIHPFASSFWQGVWMRDAGQVAITGNNFFAPNQANAVGIAFTGDQGNGYTGYPDTITGNSMLYISNVCFYNDKNYGKIVATGNSAIGCGPSSGSSYLNYVTDLNGGNDYFNNTFQFNDAAGASSGTILPNNLTIGSSNNVGTLSVVNGTGGNLDTTFSVDGSGNVVQSGNQTVGGSSIVSGSGTVGLSTAVGVAQNSGNNAIYLYAAQGHSPQVASGGSSATFYISPGGGAPSTGSTVNQANLLIPSSIILQRGVTRANINCNDIGGHAEDLLVIRDYNQYAAIGSGTQSVQNSTGTNNAEIFGLTFATTRDSVSGSPMIVGTVHPPSAGSTPALTCSGRIETQITY